MKWLNFSHTTESESDHFSSVFFHLDLLCCHYLLASFITLKSRCTSSPKDLTIYQASDGYLDCLVRVRSFRLTIAAEADFFLNRPDIPDIIILSLRLIV